MARTSFHNTASRRKEQFQPIVKDKVTLYTCGPTVYNTPHIGNWVSFVRWDVLVRVLRLSDYKVERVMNITDVGHLTGDNEGDADRGEDRMEKGARREGVTAWEIAKRYTADFMNGMKALDLIMPEYVTKATEHIGIQLELVRTLKKKGFTYQIADGIYFDTSKFPSYATFAGLDLAALKAGARVELNPEKRNPSDFALWKFSPEGQKRDMEWETPEDLLEMGDKPKTGFPGWHLECSAMAMHYLGETIDIHTGGIDHIPVHHTNEIAQSQAATGKPFAHFWLHNAHLLSDGTKISKSLGNGYTLDDIVNKGYSPLDFRMFVLQSHYRTESNFSFDNLSAAHGRLVRWRNVARLRWQIKPAKQANGGMTTTDLQKARQDALRALQDDMDTPAALRIIDEAFTQAETGAFEAGQETALQAMLEFIDQALGLKLSDTTPDISEADKQLIIERGIARQQKDWTRADELRDQLANRRIVLRDTSLGSVWLKTDS